MHVSIESKLIKISYIRVTHVNIPHMRMPYVFKIIKNICKSAHLVDISNNTLRKSHNFGGKRSPQLEYFQHFFQLHREGQLSLHSDIDS